MVKLPPPANHGPDGFCWLRPQRLGGAAMPDGFAALQQVGSKLLVSLTAEWQPDAALIARYGMHSLYTPIADFQPPTLAQARQTCAAAAAYTARGEAVVFHCQAGKGRTGTMLAAMLVWEGQTAAAAIAEVRAKNPAWIETKGQLAFLADFEAHLR